MLKSYRAALVPLLAWATLSPAKLLAQKTFEGQITAQMSAGEVTYFIKGSKVRMEMPSNAMHGFMIMDAGQGIMTTVIPSQKMYMKYDTKDATPQKTMSKEDFKITPTGQTETIAGHSCDHYLVGSEQDLDVCAAKGLGFMGGFGNNPMGGRGASSPMNVAVAELMQRFKDGFQPLKIERIEGGKHRTILVVKAIEPKPLAADLFEVPAGYHEMNMGAMKLPGRKP